LSSDAVLRLDRVTSGYPGTTVLRDVSIHVDAGEVVALIGPNGAGKTTLLRTASGLIRPTSGTVHLFGSDMSREAASRRASVGLCHIPEGRGIFRNLTVRENLFVQSKPGEHRQTVERAAEAFPRLGERLDQRAGTMSGGEQQMLALARAFVRSPRLVLVDEPSFGLAPNLVDEVFAFLANIAREGTALLVVEQFVQRALALASRVYVLGKGQVQAEATPDALDRDALAGSYFGSSGGYAADASPPPRARTLRAR
jgi:branched-chain amino acid transport system ATP-binding protein